MENKNPTKPKFKVDDLITNDNTATIYRVDRVDNLLSLYGIVCTYPSTLGIVSYEISEIDSLYVKATVPVPKFKVNDYIKERNPNVGWICFIYRVSLFTYGVKIAGTTTMTALNIIETDDMYIKVVPKFVINDFIRPSNDATYLYQVMSISLPNWTYKCRKMGTQIMLDYSIETVDSTFVKIG
jgi:hypothetical protein